MKTAFIILACGLISAGALVAQQVVEKETKTTTTTKTTTGTGTIAEYVPGSTFVLKETSGPVTYRYGNKVTYVTKSGTVIPEAELKTRIKVGNPVSVDYVTEGDSRVINKIVIDD
jgi:hypothetical protein